MEKRILVPHGIKGDLKNEFGVTYSTIDKILLGGNVRDRDKKRELRKRAIELGGVEVTNR